MLRSCVLLLGLLFSLQAQAHLLKLFASAQGSEIQGKVYFAGESAGVQAQIKITDAQGNPLAELSSDTGNFSYRTQSRIDHLLTAQTGEGHSASWTVTAEQLPANLESAQIKPSRVANQPEKMQAAEPEAPKLEAMIEQAVARQVAPLRQELQQYQDKRRLQDIIGALGYILGLAGLAAWWLARKKRPSE